MTSRTLDHCPVCRAACRGKATCHRCGMSFSTLSAVREKAEAHLENALGAYRAGDFERMFIEAGRSRSLRRTPPADRIYALSALLMKKYDLALTLWRRISL